MITIPVADLRSFFSKAKHIKDNALLPIYSYCKLVCQKNKSILYKFNGHAFIQFPVAADFKKPVTLLLNTRVLQSLTNTAVGDEITLTFDDKNVHLTDGSYKTQFQFEPPENYPVIQQPEKGDTYSLDDDVIDAISVARQHCSNNQNSQMWMRYVHLKMYDKIGYIFASNGALAYSKKFKSVLPDIYIAQDAADVVSTMRNITYSKAGNYDLFTAQDGLVYGFIQPEITMQVDFKVVLDKFDGTKNFTFDRKEMIRFAEFARAANTSSLPTEIEICESGKKSIKLKSQSISDGILNETKLDAEKNHVIEPAMFLPENIITTLKDLGVDKVTFNGLTAGCYFITSAEDKDYMGFVMMIVYSSPAPKTE